jgi:hypothetical protein
VVELGTRPETADAGESAGGAPVTGGVGGGGSGGAAQGGGGIGGKGYRFGTATPATTLDTEDFIEDNPTLTADMLQIFFTSNRDGDADVWFATRERTTDAFGEPQRLDAASTSGVDTSPAVSLDGLTLFVALDEQPGGLGGYDVFSLERASMGDSWSSPVSVAELNSAEDDIPRPPAVNGTVMPLGSRRSLEGYRTYLASRSDADSPFGEPLLIEELAEPGRSTVDGFLTEDGLTLFYSSAASEGEGDLYYALRPSADAAFGEPTPIGELNTDADERDPWLSPDGKWFYFATDSEGTLDIYYSAVSLE